MYIYWRDLIEMYKAVNAIILQEQLSETID